MTNTNEAVLREALIEARNQMKNTDADMCRGEHSEQIAKIDAALAATATVASAEQPAGDDEPYAFLVTLHDGRVMGTYFDRDGAEYWAKSYGNASKIVPLYLAAPISEDAGKGENDGMHASIFVKVWGDAGGGDAGRVALAQYAYNLGRAAASRNAGVDVKAACYRVDWSSKELAGPMLMAAMKEEIVELRAALATTAPDTSARAAEEQRKADKKGGV